MKYRNLLNLLALAALIAALVLLGINTQTEPEVFESERVSFVLTDETMSLSKTVPVEMTSTESFAISNSKGQVLPSEKLEENPIGWTHDEAHVLIATLEPELWRNLGEDPINVIGSSPNGEIQLVLSPQQRSDVYINAVITGIGLFLLVAMTVSALRDRRD